ncbi:MAG: hypothetical protein IKP88_02005 [Lachnospiraceae bacterium]|nr:hypothetical protein [Lachnospiraceae bacterium]
MENKTLLTQTEIDTLITFLENHDDTPIGAVLDQSSIDKLIEIIKYNNNKGIFFSKETSIDLTSQENALQLKNSSGNILDPEACSIIYEKGEDGFAKIFCLDSTTNTLIKLTPSCLIQKDFIEDDSKWGFAVPPRTLLKLSRLFNIKCSADTLLNAERDFAEIMYGDRNAKIADFYMK